jgi:hypothetical protein
MSTEPYLQIHYGIAVGRAACGFKRSKNTTRKEDVTCLSCKKTVKWKMNWYS